jgi:hypothetical protein
MEVFEVYMELAHEATKEIVGEQLESVEINTSLSYQKQGESILCCLELRAYTRVASSSPRLVILKEYD